MTAIPHGARCLIEQLGDGWTSRVISKMVHPARPLMTQMWFDNESASVSAAALWQGEACIAAYSWIWCADPECPATTVIGSHPSGGIPVEISVVDLRTIVTDEPRVGWPK